MTYDEFIENNGLTYSYRPASGNPNMPSGNNMDHWWVTIEVRGEVIAYGYDTAIVFSKGAGHAGNPPLLSEVLQCMRLDAMSVDGVSFEQWCAELGYDEDSRRAYATYEACGAVLLGLTEALGPQALRTLFDDVDEG